jgi:uncharacterized protein with FMN-binding domain
MKRVIFSVFATIFGLVALLSFKSHTHTTITWALPSATLGTSSSSIPNSPAPASSPTSAGSAAGEPPAPTSASPEKSTAGAVTPALPTPARQASGHPVPATTPARTSSAPSRASSSPAATSKKTYDGSAVETRYGTVQVAVTVAGTKITNVTFLQLASHDGRSADINSQAAPILLQETLTAQSSNIDTVSGATFTSEGYLQSLQSALDQAGIT